MNSIPKTALGSQGLVVPTIGLGCMGMTQIAGSDIYGQADEAEAIATIHRSNWAVISSTRPISTDHFTTNG